jgi:transcription initiation factor IIE alpha subunit
MPYTRTSPQHVRIDAYVLDTLMPDLVGHDRRPSAFIVYLLLWRCTRGAGTASTEVALEDLADLSGLSKRTVQDAIRWLQRRKLVAVRREGPTDAGTFTVLTPWRRS